MRQLTFSALMGAVLCAACGGEDLVLPSEGEPAAIAIVGGDAQTGRAGATLPDSLAVRVTDTRDRPVAGVKVAFVVADGGGRLQPDTATTDSDGRAAASWTLGSGAGFQRAEARVVGAANPLTAQFAATAGAGSAKALVAVKGEGQSAPAGAMLPDSLVVEAEDAGGNPVGGVTVRWSVSGGGSVSAGTTKTGGDGRTGVKRVLGSGAGQQSTVATADGVTGSVTFVHTATAGSASKLVLVSGDKQSAPAGTTLPNPIVVRVVDQSGNGVPNLGVVWVVGQGGGRANPVSTTTDASGRTSTTWTLGTTPGTNTLNAVVSDIGVVTASATGTGSTPPPQPSASRLVLTTQPSSSAQSGTPFAQQPVVQLADAVGNPVAASGVTVTASIASGAGSLTGDVTKSTDRNGQATFTDLGIQGDAGTRTLAFSASGLTGVTSQPISVSAPPPAPVASRSTATVPNGTVGLPTSIVVQARDRKGNKITTGGATVIVQVSGANSAGPITATDNGDGTYTASYTPTAAGKDRVQITLNGDAIEGSPYTSTVAPAASPATQVGFLTQPSGVKRNRRISPPVQVAILDDAGNLLADAVADVTIRLGANPTGASLLGTLARTAVAGVATFDDLQIDREGTGYTLLASAAGLRSTESNKFKVGK